MKKPLFLILSLLLLTLTSCSQAVILQQQEWINSLSNENRSLKDSLAQMKLVKDSLDSQISYRIYNSTLIGIPTSSEFPKDAKEVDFLFFNISDMPREYDLYRINRLENGEVERELLMTNQIGASFKYTYDPEKDKNGFIDLEAVFKSGSESTYVSAGMKVN